MCVCAVLSCSSVREWVRLIVWVWVWLTVWEWVWLTGWVWVWLTGWGVGGLNVGVADCWYIHICRCRCCCSAGRGEREAVRELEGRGLFLKSAEVATIAGTQASDVLAGKATTAVSHMSVTVCMGHRCMGAWVYECVCSGIVPCACRSMNRHSSCFGQPVWSQGPGRRSTK